MKGRIFSEKCINPDEGFLITKEGTLRPNSLGYFVYTIKELDRLGR